MGTSETLAPAGVTRNEFKIAVKDKKTISQLFPQQQISYDLWNKSEIFNNRTEVFCKAEKHASWNTDLLESEFKKDYSQLLKEAFDYSFTLESKYFYNSEDILEKGKTYIKEKASDELFYIGEYDITLLPHDNKELNLEL